jgi:hypothetical protein
MGLQILDEVHDLSLMERCGQGSNLREFTIQAKKLGFMLKATSARAYRILRAAKWPLPSGTIIDEAMEPRKAAIQDLLQNGKDDAKLGEYLQDYRRRYGIPPGHKVAVCLGWDATVATANGLQNKGGKPTNCFAFSIQPMNRKLPNLCIRCLPHASGCLDPSVHAERERLLVALKANDFSVDHMATDGDRGMDAEHVTFFNECQEMSSSPSELKVIVDALLEKGELARPIGVSDFLHGEKTVGPEWFFLDMVWQSRGTLKPEIRRR